MLVRVGVREVEKAGRGKRDCFKQWNILAIY